MDKIKELTLPLTDEQIKDLKAGDRVLLTGVLYTARDAAHKRLVELINGNKELPIDLNGSTIYYVGPTPTKKGEVIGSCGPTSSYRMDEYTEPLLKKGLKIMIGKGPRSNKLKELLKEYNALYLSSIGGAAASISSAVKKYELVCYEDLGAEAIYKLEVKDFYAIVTYDTNGGDLFLEGISKYKK